MMHNNQILYDYQTRWEVNIYEVDHAPCAGQNFCDANAGVRSVSSSCPCLVNHTDSLGVNGAMLIIELINVILLIRFDVMRGCAL